jgi:ATP-dependent DNA ligase
LKTFQKLYKATTGGGKQVWQIKVVEGPKGSGIMITTYGLEGGKMQETRDTITEGKNIGKKNATTAYEQACAEAESRWNKQKDRKGYGLTVEESAEVRGASPMLAHTYDKHAKKVDWGNAFAQPKLDGFRCLVRITPDGKVTMTSRENQPFTALADMRDVISEVAKGTRVFADIDEVVLDGELYSHGMSLNEISSACKRKSDKTKLLQYHVYDAMLGTADFTTRYAFAKDFVEAAGSDLLVPVDTVKVRSETELMRCQSEFMADGFEGAMLRYGGVGYQAGKRSPHLLKVKTFQDAEFMVIDFKNGRGKYADCAVFVCETEDGNTFEVTAPGGLEEKRKFLTDAKKYIGQKLTVKFQYMTKTEEPVPFLPVGIAFRSMGKKVT